MTDLHVIEKGLQEHGIPFRAGQIVVGRSIKTTCPQCSHHRKNKRDLCLSLSVKADGAVWKCHNCGHTGGVSDGSRSFAKAGHTPTPMTPRRDWDQPKPLPSAPQLTPPATKWLEQERKISRETALAAGLYSTTYNGLPALAFPYFLDGDVVAQKYRLLGNKEFRQDANCKPCLYGWDDAVEALEDSHPTLVFTEGEMDVLALAEAGVKAVSLRDGAPAEAKHDEHDRRFAALAEHPELGQFERIIIASDMDGPGEALAQELAARFGKHRCYRARWPEDGKDANDCLIRHGPERVRRVIDEARPYPVKGITQPLDHIDEILAMYHGRLAKPYEVNGAAEFRSAYKVEPGLHLITGYPNHGKSSFLDQMSLYLADMYSWHIAVFSPEHTPRGHIARLAEMREGAPFWDGPTLRMTEDQLRRAVGWLDRRYSWIIPQEGDVSTPAWIMAQAEKIILRSGAKALIVDPFNEVVLQGDTREAKTDAIGRMLSEFKQFAFRHEIVVFVVAHPKLLGRDASGNRPVPTLNDVAGSHNWNAKADGGLVVHRPDLANPNYNGPPCTEVYVAKVRDQPRMGVNGRMIRFKYNGATRRFDHIHPDQDQEEHE